MNRLAIEEAMIGPDGPAQRMYPAPSPITAPLNADTGWTTKELPSRGRQVAQGATVVPRNTDSGPIIQDNLLDSDQTRVLNISASPRAGAYVEWVGVT